MWQPVHDKYRPFLETAWQLQPIVNDMTSCPVSGQLSSIVCRMVCAGANSMGALLTLVLNGYGPDAMKIARSIYEVELNILWLKNHPDDIRDFVDYNVIQQEQLFDTLTEEEQQQVPKEQYDRMMAEYNEALPRFGTKRDPTRARNEWCSVSLYQRAKDSDEYWQRKMGEGHPERKLASLYAMFCGPASSLNGVLVQMARREQSEAKVFGRVTFVSGPSKCLAKSAGEQNSYLHRNPAESTPSSQTPFGVHLECKTDAGAFRDTLSG